MSHTDKQHAITQEKSSPTTSNQAKRKYITHVHTQAKQEHDNQDEYNKDNMLKDDQDNIQTRESTLRQTRYTTM